MLIKINQIDVVVNCVGIVKQRTDISTHEMIAVNSVFPHILQKACAANGVKLIHISTDCVYSGEKGQYNENDIHDATDIYGKSKSLGEPLEATVIRTSIIGSEKKRKLSFLEWAKSQKGKDCCGYVNHKWNGVTALNLARMIAGVIVFDRYWKGVRHYYSGSPVTKNSLLHLVSNIYELNLNITPYVSDFCDRSLSSVWFLSSQEDLFTQIKLMREFDEKNGLYDSLQ
jgi:dTDP-4-dehydrorhamnose reductase